MGISKDLRRAFHLALATLVIMGLWSCSKTDLGSNAAAGAVTTTISGKVSLPVALANKPGYKAEMLAKAASGKPGSSGFKPSSKPVAGEAAEALPSQAASLIGASVELYSATHPEWVYPVADATTDASGNYTLSTLKNAANNGDAYVDGAPLPTGNYTLLAKKIDPVTGEYQAAVQNIVKRFSGQVTGTDLIAQPSDAAPKVMTMVGAKKNSDGTNTWGGTTSPAIAKNSAVQVVFSMAMSRLTVINGGLTLSPAVTGHWTISADWTTATFYPDSQLAPGTYTVTVNGVGAANPVRNVYENPLPATAVGTFAVVDEVDSVKPTGIIISPDASNVALTSAIRIAANELLDVNGISLTSTPTMGDQPTVHYLGKSEDMAGQYQYIYEFIPSKPLKLSTDYDITISSARDLAGNAMRSLNFSFGTADSAAGVDSAATAEIQALQADVLSVFGKWTHAMNEHNLASLQSVMSGEFVLEYDATQGIGSEDLNADGRYSMAEFSGLMEDAFLGWEYCGTSITGAVDELINVDQTTGLANLAFHLSATSANTTRQCQDSAPNEPFFMNLRLQNGVWQIERASQGIDTRDKSLVVRDYIKLLSPVNNAINSDPADPSGVTVDTAMAFDWEAPASASVSSYIFVIWNDNEEGVGRAYVVKSLLNSSIDLDLMGGRPQIPYGADIIDVSSKLGLSAESGATGQPGITAMKLDAPGESFRWVVMGLGNNTYDDFKNNRDSAIFRDIVAISPSYKFTNPGVRQMVTPQVMVTATGAEVTFSEYLWGYDAGNSGRITLNLYSTAADAMNGSSGTVSVSGHMWASYPVTFDANGFGSVTFDLYKGMNWISYDDGAGLWGGITVATSGGIPPVMQVTSVTTDNGLSLIPDSWGYVSALGAKNVTISGTVANTAITSVDMWLWNQNGAYKNKTVSVAGGAFSVSVDIYPGDNWVSLGGSYTDTSGSWIWASAYLGVYTDTGSVYVPPITVAAVTAATITENYGSNSNWDASGDTDNLVTITGKLNEVLDLTNSPPTYSISSDGGWWTGNLNVLPDGSYALDVALYNGWTWVSISDGVGNWYGLNLYTSKGQAVYRPQITSVDGVDMATFSGAIADCKANIVGTAAPNSLLSLYWDGYDGATSYSDSSTVVVDGSGNFSVAVRVVSSSDPLVSSYNYIDLYDSQWRWAGAYVITSKVGCGWVAPRNTVTSATDGSESIASSSFIWDSNWWSWLIPFTNTATGAVTIDGVNSQAGRAITATIYDSCGGEQTRVTPSDGTGIWSLAGLPTYNGWNDINITDGVNDEWFGVDSTSAQQPPQSIGFSVTGATETGSGCGWSDWDSGSAATVDVTVTTTGTQNGQGILYTEQGATSLTFVNGVATATGVKVYGIYSDVTVPGEWNYLTVYDPDWNTFYPYVWSTNSNVAPKPLGITSPLQNDVVGAGTVTVSARWDTATFNPDYLYAYVEEYDALSGSWVSYEYSNDGWYSPFSVIDNDPTSPNYGTFSFDVPLSGADDTYIYVYGSSWTSGQSHANGITVNNASGYTEWWYKPSAGGKPAKQTATRQERRAAEKALKSEKASRAKHHGRLH